LPQGCIYSANLTSTLIFYSIYNCVKWPINERDVDMHPVGHAKTPFTCTGMSPASRDIMMHETIDKAHKLADVKPRDGKERWEEWSV